MTYTTEQLAEILAANKVWWLGTGGGKRADLQGADLRGAYLQGAYLQGADLRGADLQRADLRGADLRGAYLQGADLRGADLQGADLQGAYLRGADLQGADLRGADLRGADLQGAYLQGAYLQGADLQGAYLQGAADKTKKWIADGSLLKYKWWAAKMQSGTILIRYGCECLPLTEWRARLSALCNQHEPSDIERYEAAIGALLNYVEALAKL